MNRRLIFVLGFCLHCSGRPVAAEPRSLIRHDTIVRDVAMVEKGKQAPPVKRRFDAVVLENQYLTLTVCPALGERIVRLVDKHTGRQLLYEGVLKYSGSALTEGGGSGGGIQINHPYYHAGSSYVVPLPFVTETLADGTAVLTLAYTSYPHLQRTVWRIRLRSDEAAFRTDYRFENLAPYAMGFNPWICAAFPLRKDVQFVLPADWVTGHWFGINDREQFGNWLRPWPIDKDGRDQSHLVHCTEPSVFGYGVTEGYSGIWFHDANDGLARVFDPVAMPGAKAAGKWQAEPRGWDWVEIWGACSHNMEDPLWLGPHETIRSSDLWFPLHGLGGLTWANEQAAIRLQKETSKDSAKDSAEGRLACGVFPTRDYGRCSVRLVADSQTVLQRSVELRPGKPFLEHVACPAGADEVRLTVTTQAGRELVSHRRFFAARPRKVFELPAKPWHRQTPFTQARWEEAFTPLMAWGPWYHPPTSYAKLLEAEPTNREAQLGRARSLLKEAGGDLFRARKKPPEELRREAVDILTRLSEGASPDSRAVLLLGVAHFQQADHEAAAKTFSRLSGTAGDDAQAHYYRALLAAGAGDWPRAHAAAQSALALAPDSTLVRLFVAVAALRTNRAETVSGVLAPVLDGNPLEVGALLLQRRAAETAGQADAGRAASATLSAIEKLSPHQHQAGVDQVTSLESGRDLNCLTIDTIRGATELPGRAP